MTENLKVTDVNKHSSLSLAEHERAADQEGPGERQEQTEEQDQDPGQGPGRREVQGQARTLSVNLLTLPWTANSINGTQFSDYMAAQGESFGSKSRWVSVLSNHLPVRAPWEVTCSSSKQFEFALEHSPIQAKDCRYDIPPLPLMLSDEDLRWDMAAADRLSSRGASIRAEQCTWSRCIMLVLNTWATAPQGTYRNPDGYCCLEALANKSLCPAQSTTLALLDLMANLCVHLWMSSRLKPRSWTELLAHHLDSYAGRLTTKAHHIDCEQVVPPLPPMSLAERVSTADLPDKRLREILFDSRKPERPHSEWPRTLNRTRIRANPVEQHRPAAELVRRRTLGVPQGHEAVNDSDCEYLGADPGGVPKGQSVTRSNGESAEVLRLMINLIPTNAILRNLSGSPHALAYEERWPRVKLDGDVVLWSAENLRCGSYSLGRPAASGKWAMLQESVPDKLVYHPAQPLAYPWRLMVPMDWASDAGPVQCLFRQPALEKSRLPAQVELRRDPSLLCDSAFLVGEWWQIYLANYDKVHSYRKAETMRAAEGKLSCWGICLRESGEALRVLFTSEPDLLRARLC